MRQRRGQAGDAGQRGEYREDGEEKSTTKTTPIEGNINTECHSNETSPRSRETEFTKSSTWLMMPTDAYRLAIFRIVFGFCMAWHIISAMQKDVIDANFNDYFPEINFHYYFALGVERPPVWVVRVVFYVAAVSAGLMSLGILSRLASLTFLVLFTYINLLEKARYNNHYYLYILLSFLFVITDSARVLSLDSLLRRRNHNKPATIPFWNLAIFRFQIFVCYFYGSLAKMNKDWVLRGEPCKTWFTRVPLLSGLAEFLVGSNCADNLLGFGFCISGLIFDFVIGFMLLSRRFRPLGFLFTAIFHITNHFVFKIGTFPWTMLATNILFIESETIPSLIQNICQRFIPSSKVHGPTDTHSQNINDGKDSDDTKQADKTPPSQDDGETINSKERKTERKSIFEHNEDQLMIKNPKLPTNDKTPNQKATSMSPFTATLLTVHILVQLLVPFRHWAYPGDVNWSMEGHQFSWRMMLNEEDVLLRMLVKPANQTQEIMHKGYNINARQLKRMITDPELILQYAQHLSSVYGSPEEPASVRVDMLRSLNHRPYQRWVDPDINLGMVEYKEWSYSWLEPQIPDTYINFSSLLQVEQHWHQQDREVSFFIQNPGQMFKTFVQPRYCTNVSLYPVTEAVEVEIKKTRTLVAPHQIWPLPSGAFHRVHSLGTEPTVWAYVHDCPKPQLHQAIMMISIGSWQFM